MDISDITTPETYSSLTKKQRAILNAWYDNDCEGSPFVSKETGCSTSMVMKTVNSELGQKYLSWRAKQDGQGKIDKDKIVKELNNIAFANYDDCYDVKENRDSGKMEYVPKNMAELSKRERRRIKSAIGVEHGKWGTKFSMNFKAKMDALERLEKLADALNPDNNKGRHGRSGNAIMSRIKKLSGLKQGRDKDADTGQE